MVSRALGGKSGTEFINQPAHLSMFSKRHPSALRTSPQFLDDRFRCKRVIGLGIYNWRSFSPQDQGAMLASHPPVASVTRYCPAFLADIATAAATRPESRPCRARPIGVSESVTKTSHFLIRQERVFLGYFLVMLP